MSGKIPHYAAMLLCVHLASACSDGGPPNRAPQGQTPGARSAVEAKQAPAPEAQDQKLVLAFGDSLYAGYGLKQNESFPYDLEQALRRQGIAARVHNAGVSGDTTAAGRQRLAFTLDGLPRKPDLAIVGLGANDMLRGLDPQLARDNLSAILAEFRRRGIPIMLTGMLAAPNMGRDYGARFNAIYPDLAKEYDAELYPFFLAGVVTSSALMLPDHLHPNAAGVDAIVARVAPIVAKKLRA
ncbi:MAG: lipolytic protein family [Alphaproteobacteria bacterium]|nr:lipolytic protein family [Alphaproteobacteria bacterium]